MKIQNVIIKPIITEGSMKLVTAGKYTFAVTQFADKGSIKNVIGKLYGVTVVAVATSVVKGKSKRVGQRREEVKGTIWKKAIVTVKKGEKIGVFEPGGEETHEHKK